MCASEPLRTRGRFSDAAATARASRPALALLAVLLAILTAAPRDATAQPAGAQSEAAYAVPDLGALPDDAHGRLVRRGRDLFTATYAEIGPEVADPAKRYAGNALACSNCHLNAGVKRFGLPLWGVSADYPRYDVEAGRDISIEHRVNGCMQRSMNGRAMPADAPEMQALVAYLGFLSTGVAAGEALTGMGAGHMPELDRAADPERGRPIYAATCALCHGSNGGGVRRGLSSMAEGFAFPPLWGPQSFNDGAGMNRLITAANFLHANMPNGVSYDHPQLSVEEAWDVAAYVVAQPRPQKPGLDRDFPDRATKPVDTPYGPYVDGFSERQHKFGPFGPIREALTRLRAETASPAASRR